MEEKIINGKDERTCGVPVDKLNLFNTENMGMEGLFITACERILGGNSANEALLLWTRTSERAQRRGGKSTYRNCNHGVTNLSHQEHELDERIWSTHLAPPVFVMDDPQVKSRKVTQYKYFMVYQTRWWVAWPALWSFRRVKKGFADEPSMSDFIPSRNDNDQYSHLNKPSSSSRTNYVT